MYKYPFDGFDFTELTNRWNVYIPDDCYKLKSEWKDDWYWAENYLTSIFKTQNKRVMKYIANDIRQYCSAMCSNYNDISYACPIFKGFSEVEDDYTLIQYFIPLIGYAWV